VKIVHHFHDLCSIGQVYLVGGSVRDHILGRPSNDHDFVVPGDAKAFAQRVGTARGVRMIEMGKDNKAIYRVVSGNQILDFSPMAGNSIQDDLKARDFTINSLAYDLQSQRLIDPVGALDDIESKTIRLISQDAVLADPLRMLRAFRLGAVLGFDISRETLAVIKKQSPLIKKSAGERVRIELFRMMEAKSSFCYLKNMFQSGLLTHILPELELCRGCMQNEIHGGDVLEHAMSAYEEMETILGDCAKLWPEFAKEIDTYLRADDRKVLLKWAAMLHDLGKPATRSVDASGRVRFLGHEEEGARHVKDICTRLKMSRQNRLYVTFIVQEHLRPLFLFDAEQRGSLTSRGIVRFARKYQDDIIGLVIHSVADQRAKGGARDESLRGLTKFFQGMLSLYFCDLRPKMTAQRLVTGHDLIKHFNLKPSELVGRLLDKVEEGRLSGQIETKKEAIELVARLIK
jgi:putative nucleotidyltransferase with HDIG domain